MTPIELLKRKIVPWNGPAPIDITFGEYFTGSKALLLRFAAQKHRFAGKRWGTLSQWKRKSLYKSNSQATMDLYNEDQFCKPKQQLPQYECDTLKNDQGYTAPQYDLADAVIASTGANVRFTDEIVAEYHYPPADYILISKKYLFNNINGYYYAMFHELMHYSEKQNYNDSVSELRAEIGSAYLSSMFNIPHISWDENRNLTTHLSQWVKLLEEPGFIAKITSWVDEGLNFLLKSLVSHYAKASYLLLSSKSESYAL